MFLRPRDPTPAIEEGFVFADEEQGGGSEEVEAVDGKDGRGLAGQVEGQWGALGDVMRVALVRTRLPRATLYGPSKWLEAEANTAGGLHAEDLILVVGKPNVGKSLFVSQHGGDIPSRAACMGNNVVCLMICCEHA